MLCFEGLACVIVIIGSVLRECLAHSQNWTSGYGYKLITFYVHNTFLFQMCDGCLDLRKAPNRRNMSLLMNVCIVIVHNMFDWSGTLREDQ